MAIVNYFLPDDAKLTPEEEAEIEALKNFDDPMDDPDCPPTTEDQHKMVMYLIQKYRTGVLTKEMYIKEGLIKA